jgi:hypothetical protein
MNCRRRDSPAAAAPQIQVCSSRDGPWPASRSPTLSSAERPTVPGFDAVKLRHGERRDCACRCMRGEELRGAGLLIVAGGQTSEAVAEGAREPAASRLPAAGVAILARAGGAGIPAAALFFPLN